MPTLTGERVEGVPLRALVWLGTVSSGAYLWNYPLTMWLRALLPEPSAGLVAAVLTLPVAGISWCAVERPLSARPLRRVHSP